MWKYLWPWIIGEWGILPYSDLFNVAWYTHDIGWERAIHIKILEAIKEKFKTDFRFLRIMKLVAKTKTQIFFAYLYFFIVLSFWSLYFIFLYLKKMLELKTTLTALLIATLWYLALPGEMLFLFVWLMIIDTFLRYISGHIYKDFNSSKARIWILSKITLLFIPFWLAIMFKIFELWNIDSWYTKNIITWLIAILAVWEFYSIIKNYIYLRTWEKPTEYDWITMILKKILWKIQNFLETYLK